MTRHDDRTLAMLSTPQSTAGRSTAGLPNWEIPIANFETRSSMYNAEKSIPSLRKGVQVEPLNLLPFVVIHTPKLYQFSTSSQILQP
jgi:hypothetical protein